MKAALPDYATLVIGVTIFANVLSAAVILATMGKNKGLLYDQGPPWMVALSALCLFFLWFDLLMDREVAFWFAAGFAAFALWGAWVDYVRVVEYASGRAIEKERKKRMGG
jgi:hypothetical protein